MWLRLIGLFLVVGSCALYYAQAPRGVWWKTTLAEAPLSTTEPVRLSFVAPDNAPCNVMVRYHPMTTTHGSPAFICGAHDGTQLTKLLPRASTQFIGEEREDCIGALNVTAGHHYTIEVRELVASASPETLSSSAKVQFSGRRLNRDPVQGMIALSCCGFWCFVGLILTFISRFR